jgi:hypothetical protein
MDATRARRQKDPLRRRYYAACRQLRLARHLGFVAEGESLLAAQSGRSGRGEPRKAAPA